MLGSGGFSGEPLPLDIPAPQLPAEFKEKQAASRCPVLWLAKLGGHAQGRTGNILAPEDLTAHVRR